MSWRTSAAQREPIRDRGEIVEPHLAGASAPRWRTTSRIVATALALGAPLLIVADIGYYRMFSYFAFWDDEGCVLITLKSFIDGHPLYDDVFSMYGPLPILLRWLIFTVAGVPVGHDAGRLIALGYWLASAMLCSAAAWRLTRSIVAAWAAGLFVFHVLGLLTMEPGHPQDLCTILLGLAVFLATFIGAPSGRRPALLIMLGIVAGCLAMTKINVFVFLMMALGAALLSLMRRTRLTAVVGILFAVGLLIAPRLLMRDLYFHFHVRSYTLHATLALVPILILAIGRRVRAIFNVRDCAWIALGLLASIAMIAAVVLLRGTTPAALLDGVVMIPLRAGVRYFGVTSAFLGHWPIPVAFIVVALAWLALERARLASRPVPTLGSAVVRIAYGGFVLYWNPFLVGNVPYDVLLAYGVPAAVLVLVGRDAATGSARDAFGRVFLAFLSATEVLWAYPVSGSQMAGATFLSALILIVVVADGCHDLAALCAQWARWPTWIVVRLGKAAVVAVFWMALRAELNWANYEYEHRQPLDLPGAHAIRLDAPTVNNFRQLAHGLHDLPDSFFTLPGMYSLYFWSERESPTALTLTNWMYMLDDGQQERIVAQLASRPELRVVYSPNLVQFWAGSLLQPSPLVRYIDANFAPATTIAGDEIWIRQPTPRPPGAKRQLPIRG